MNITPEQINSFSGAIVTVFTVLGGGIAWVYSKLDTRRKVSEAATDARFVEVSKRLDDCEKDRVEMRSKIIVLESGLNSRAPMWVRNQNGAILSVTSEFVRLFGLPYGLRSSDLVGKKFSDFPAFSQQLIADLDELDKAASRSVYASKAMEISPGSHACVHKIATADSSGEIFFVGYAFPRSDNAD